MEFISKPPKIAAGRLNFSSSLPYPDYKKEVEVSLSRERARVLVTRNPSSLQRRSLASEIGASSFRALNGAGRCRAPQSREEEQSGRVVERWKGKEGGRTRHFNIDVNSRRFQSDATSRTSLAVRWCYQLEVENVHARQRLRKYVCVLHSQWFLIYFWYLVHRSQLARNRTSAFLRVIFVSAFPRWWKNRDRYPLGWIH